MTRDTCIVHHDMLSLGIVGLPNVGKSTLFNALTRSKQADAQNYPFCTIDRTLVLLKFLMNACKNWPMFQNQKK